MVSSIGKVRPFINEDFLLTTSRARELYHGYAAEQPILDYHCHLSPHDIAENRQFQNLHEIWLEGDHYKWRAMRANGVPEEYCTGKASAYDKFLAWAKTVPHTLGNPLYHWTHLELKRYFEIEEQLNEDSAPRIWERANELLAKKELSAQGILRKFRVKVVCTTDDPTDSLSDHHAISSSACDVGIYPTFRPDRTLRTDDPNNFGLWLHKLEQASQVEITSFVDFLRALRTRHVAFEDIGGRLSDHGLERCYANHCTEAVAAAIFEKVRSGRAASPEEQDQFASYLMLFFGRLDAEKGWTKQLHLGARRNASTRMLSRLGPDTGFDSIGDFKQISALGAYLDRLEQESALPKMIIYNLNPADNYAIASICGNFQDGETPGKIQFGSGWWFLDQKNGIEMQLTALANTGLLSRFVGMLTDSRSFMSFTRHEYFRRVLCNWVGAQMESGELPNDTDLLGKMVANICFGNAQRYFGFAALEK